MDELLDALELTTNVESLQYSDDSKTWLVKYKNGLSPDILESSELINFLKEG